MAGNRQFVLLLVLLLTAAKGVAHHSRSTFYDLSRTIEIEGVVTRVQWRHPHVRYWLQADAEFGGEEWELETTPPSILERQGISPDILAVNTRIRVAGAPARVAEHAMEASHVLLPDGREVLLHRGSAPLWTNNTVERDAENPYDDAAVAAAHASASGIFRVWSRAFPNPDPLWAELDDYPLNADARAVADAWDPISEIDTSCAGKEMPSIMSTIWPMEFVDEGEQIRLLLEENDRVRTIHLQDSEAATLPSPFGHSVGHWEGPSTLVVNTTGISARILGGWEGVPLSGNTATTERFMLSEDEHRLDYEITIVDPLTFNEPVTLDSFWTWKPGEAVKPYSCVHTPDSWTADSDKELLGN